MTEAQENFHAHPVGACIRGPQWTGCCHLSALACLCGWLQALSPDHGLLRRVSCGQGLFSVGRKVSVARAQVWAKSQCLRQESCVPRYSGEKGHMGPREGGPAFAPRIPWASTDHCCSLFGFQSVSGLEPLPSPLSQVRVLAMPCAGGVLTEKALGYRCVLALDAPLQNGASSPDMTLRTGADHKSRCLKCGSVP